MIAYSSRESERPTPRLLLLIYSRNDCGSASTVVTLILSCLTPAYVLQTADRLVTVHGTRAPFDELANKNLIFWARDAIVCMAYTGAAYIGRFTTDEWIAEKLTGLSMGQRFSFKTGPLPQWLDIGQAMTLLRNELMASEIARHDANFELVTVGWMWNRAKRPFRGWNFRRWPVPMGWLIQKPSHGVFGEIQRLPRYWHYPSRSYLTSGPEANFDPAQLKALGEQLRPLNNDVSATEQMLVDTMRGVSGANPSVGPNCMSVLLPPPNLFSFVRVKFFPQHYHSAELVTPALARRLRVAYSPWLIGEGVISKPSILSGAGDVEIHMGPFTVVITELPSEPVHLMSSQPRPRRP